MPDSGTGCACSLIEVARILVQQRGQYGATNHDVRKTVDSSHPCSFAKRAPALSEVGTVSSLLSAGYKKDSRGGHRINGDFEGELELHLCRKRRRITLKGHVEVWDDSEDSLLFLGLELLGCYVHGIVMNIDSGSVSLNSESDSSHNFELARIEGDGG